MKLLLTSNGICNASLANALKNLVKRPIKIAFIPTAANVVDEEKSWLLNDLNNCKKLGDIDIVDISALPKSVWLRRLKRSNVIVVGGGNTHHLVKCIISSDLKKELPKLLKKRVYVGISAGSIATGKTLKGASDFILSRKKPPKGLGFVDFYIRPHLNSPKRRNITDKKLEKVARKLDANLYAIDDDSAILVNGDRIEVISEGKWKLYKKAKK